MKKTSYRIQFIGIILAFFMLEFTNPVNGQEKPTR